MNINFTAKTTDSLNEGLALYRTQYEDAIQRGDLIVADRAMGRANAIRDELNRRATEGDALIEAVTASPEFITVRDSDHLAALLGLNDAGTMEGPTGEPGPDAHSVSFA
jgi:hypothetical protein